MTAPSVPAPPPVREGPPAPSPVAAGHRRRLRRVAAVLASVLAAVLVWFVADPIMGQELRVGTEGVDERVLEVGVFPMVQLSLLASLAGWASLAGLERFVRRARGIWLTVAAVAFAVSFLPLTDPGMTDATRGWLALTHVVVAVVLVPGLLGPRHRPVP